MTRFHRSLRQLPYRRELCVGLVCCLLLGALFGTLLAKLSFLSPSDFLLPSSVSFSDAPVPGKWFHFALFPTLLLAASILRSRWLGYLFVFGKGLLCSYLLSVSCYIGFDAFRQAALSFFFQTLLPLPMLLYVFTVWLEELRGPRIDFWLLLPCYLSGLIGILLEHLLF